MKFSFFPGRQKENEENTKTNAILGVKKERLKNE